MIFDSRSVRKSFQRCWKRQHEVWSGETFSLRRPRGSRRASTESTRAAPVRGLPAGVGYGPPDRGDGSARISSWLPIGKQGKKGIGLTPARKWGSGQALPPSLTNGEDRLIPHVPGSEMPANDYSFADASASASPSSAEEGSSFAGVGVVVSGEGGGRVGLMRS